MISIPEDDDMPPLLDNHDSDIDDSDDSDEEDDDEGSCFGASDEDDPDAEGVGQARFTRKEVQKHAWLNTTHTSRHHLSTTFTDKS
jgi:hypothetical protein